MLYKVALRFESVDEILKCDHSNNSYRVVHSCGAVCCAVQGGSTFWFCGWNPNVWPFKWKILSSNCLWCCLLMFFKIVLTFEFVNEILKCDHSNESYGAVLPCGAVFMLYKVVLTFESVDEILKCDHSNQSYWAVLSCGAVCYAVHSDSNVWVCRWNPKVWPFKWKLLSSTFLWCCLLCCTWWL